MTTPMRARTMPPRRRSFRDVAHNRPAQCRRGALRVRTVCNAAYFFSGSVDPGCLNGNELNIDFA